MFDTSTVIATTVGGLLTLSAAHTLAAAADPATAGMDERITFRCILNECRTALHARLSHAVPGEEVTFRLNADACSEVTRTVMPNGRVNVRFSAPSYMTWGGPHEIEVVGHGLTRRALCDERLLLWNRLESRSMVETGDLGAGFYQTSYIYGPWQEARIELAWFGNGLFVNHDTREGGNNDGANFFALDTRQAGLSAARGCVEFWSRFKYGCAASNWGRFFLTAPELTGHFQQAPVPRVVDMMAGWQGWKDQKFFHFMMKHADDPDYAWAQTPPGSAGPGGHLAFATDDDVHFAFVYDVDGIDGTADTVRIYVNGELEASDDYVWTTAGGMESYWYLGTRPGHERWDHYYNAVKGVTDNLKIWNYAKTDFSDRFHD